MKNVTMVASCLSLMLAWAAPTSASALLSKDGVTASQSTDFSTRKKKMKKGMMRNYSMQQGGGIGRVVGCRAAVWAVACRAAEACRVVACRAEGCGRVCDLSLAVPSSARATTTGAGRPTKRPEGGLPEAPIGLVVIRFVTSKSDNVSEIRTTAPSTASV